VVVNWSGSFRARNTVSDARSVVNSAEVSLNGFFKLIVGLQPPCVVRKDFDLGFLSTMNCWDSMRADILDWSLVAVEPV